MGIEGRWREQKARNLSAHCDYSLLPFGGHTSFIISERGGGVLRRVFTAGSADREFN